MDNIQNLNGIWKAWPSKKGPLPRAFYETPEITNKWFDIKVPSNWQTQSNFNDDNIVYYYTTFTTPNYTDKQNVILELSRVYNECEVWLNGEWVGVHSGYFIPFRINVTRFIKTDINHIFLKVTWPASSDKEKNQMLGVYGEWEYNNDELTPGGLCGDIRLSVVNDVYISDIVVDYTLTEHHVADVLLRVNMSCLDDRKVIFDWSLTPHNFEGQDIKGSINRDIKKGSSYIKLNFIVNKPQLWYPWEQGLPNLYQLRVKLYDEEHLKDEKSIIVGFRSITDHNECIYINDNRQFLRGIIYLPTKIHFSNITRKDLERDIQLILDAGINTIRLFQHVPSQEFYDICNENGLLLWQDIPYNYTTQAKNKNNVLKKTVSLYNKLQANPSLVIWGIPSKVDMFFLTKLSRRLIGNSTVQQMIKTLKKIDKSRVIVENKKYYNLLRMFDWRHKDSTKDSEFKIAQERITITKGRLKIISSYGYPAFPEIATMIEMSTDTDNENKSRWLGSSRNSEVYLTRIEQKIPLEEYERASAYYMASQNYQARLLLYYHELWRKSKYRPFCGCFMYFFVDNSLVVSDSIVDYYRRPKQGYSATKRSMQPVCVLMDWPAEYYMDGDIVRLQIYVINDIHTAFPSSILRWEILNSEKEIIIEDRKIIDMLGDDNLAVGLVLWEVTSEIEPGDYRVNLELELPTQECLKNSYELKIRV